MSTRITIPAGESLWPSQMVKGCLSCIEDQVMEADLFWGIYWLAKNHAFMDCYNKEVTFTRPGLPKVVLCGEVGRPLLRLIFALIAKKLLKKGFQRYLAHKVDTRVSWCRVGRHAHFHVFSRCFSQRVTDVIIGERDWLFHWIDSKHRTYFFTAVSSGSKRVKGAKGSTSRFGGQGFH